MKQMVFVFLAGGMVGLAPSSLVAQGIEIVHDGVGCVVAERFPRLEARVEPASAAGRVRIQFRTEGGAGWYFVEMKPAAGLFSGVLPKPKKSLKRFSYYIEVTGTSFEATRTAEYSPAVVTSAQECRAPLPAAGVTSAGSVVVGGPAGAPAVPPGFAASGVTAATATAAGAATRPWAVQLRWPTEVTRRRRPRRARTHRPEEQPRGAARHRHRPRCQRPTSSSPRTARS
jgi:hypothetical protein